MVGMNLDTEEAWDWICRNEEYYYLLKTWIGNELMFIDTLVDIIIDINKLVSDVSRISYANVNGNEIYIEFCKLTGNENEPHW